MRISTRVRYAVMAMAELAAKTDLQDADRPVTLAEIAGSQGLSIAYLEQLFLHLRRAALVTSARGPGGGYRLARPASEITISAIAESVEEPFCATRCSGGEIGCLAGRRCRTHDLWAELGDHMRLFLKNMTLADVVGDRVCGRAAMPFPHDRALAEKSVIPQKDTGA